MERINAIIVAGGSGMRFGQKKQFISLAGEPVLKKTVEAFDIPEIQRLIIVVPESDISLIKDYININNDRFIVTAGGITRQASVFNGLKASSDSGIVLIHDGVRPFVTRRLIKRVIDGLSDADGCIPVIPVTDTIKQASNGMITRTLSRENLYSVQTPQAFRYDNILKAHVQAALRTDASTDDSMLIEEAGGIVRTVEGERFNIKITLSEDMVTAEAIYAFQNRNRL
jgi:2-C-methyl-D-erythritol 4-phosphate cytidylyltransferase